MGFSLLLESFRIYVFSSLSLLLLLRSRFFLYTNYWSITKISWKTLWKRLRDHLFEQQYFECLLWKYSWNSSRARSREICNTRNQVYWDLLLFNCYFFTRLLEFFCKMFVEWNFLLLRRRFCWNYWSSLISEGLFVWYFVLKLRVLSWNVFKKDRFIENSSDSSELRGEFCYLQT